MSIPNKEKPICKKSIPEYYKNIDISDIVYFCEFDQCEKTEKWKIFNEYPNYEVSDLGRVKSLSRIRNNRYSFFINNPKILKQRFNLGGRLVLNFKKDNKLRTFQIHQLVAIVFMGHKPCGFKLVVDHKDNIRTNNTLSNLQITTQRINMSKDRTGTSKYTGVGWYEKHNKWRAKIHINGKQKHLGMFKKEIDAHNAYQKALKEI